MCFKKAEGSEFFNDTQAEQNEAWPIFCFSTSKGFFQDSTADKTQTKKVAQYIMVSYLHLLKLNLSQHIFIKYQL